MAKRSNEGLGPIQEWQAQVTANRAKLREEAEKLGLTLFPSPTSRVWVEKDYEKGEGQMPNFPTRFWREEDTRRGTDPKLRQYEVNFPIATIPELGRAIGTVMAFVGGITDPMEYIRGDDPITAYVEALQNQQPKPGTSPFSGKIYP